MASQIKTKKTNAGTSVLKKKRNLWFYVSLVFFFSTIGVYFWKEYQINQTKKNVHPEGKRLTK